MEALPYFNQNRLAINSINKYNNNPNDAFSYIIDKNNKHNKEIRSDISFVMVLSIALLAILLMFISYKTYIYMNMNITNVDIGIFPYNNSLETDGYDINYLSEQVYYKSLSDTDKDLYLSLSDFEKDTAIKKFFVAQIIL
jgi:hypothetical protein